MVLAALGSARRYKISALPIPADWARHLNLFAPASPAPPSPPASQDVTANTETPAAVPPKPPETPETLDAAQPSTPLAQSAPSTPVADVDAPAGSVPALPNLRGQFNEPARAADLQRVARQEQELWDKATAYLQDGDLDDADKSLRDILALPEVGPRWSDAAHYVDQVIPERRRNQQLWAAALFAATSQAPGHPLQEIKMLDELLSLRRRAPKGSAPNARYCDRPVDSGQRTKKSVLPG